MKRNESILVYSVTGLLVVILAVAILFGNDSSANAGELSKGLDDLELVRTDPPADEGSKAPVGEPATGSDAPRTSTSPDQSTAPPTPEQKWSEPPKSEVVPDPKATQADGSKAPPEGMIAQPLVAPAPQAKPAAEVEAATQALVLLGESKRDGDYRIVTVRRGDTFSELVQRWCGNLDALPLAESLNEEANLANLKEGTKLCMPWVDDAKLVAAQQSRRAKVESEGKVLSEARAQGRVYTVKAGDKLWNIAVAQVGAKGAAKFIEEIKALNPELMTHPDRLSVGKTILLPQR